MKAISLLFLAVCVILAAANVNTQSDRLLEPRIIGGQKAAKGQFPYQVSLREIISRRHFCGASIITNRFLLTAAHCTSGLHMFPAFIVAVVGAVNRRFDGVTMRINNIIGHEDWNSLTLQHDIALIYTAGEIVFTRTVQPIALPQQNLEENSVVLSGWGQTYNRRDNEPGMFLPFTLQYLEAHSLTHEKCVDAFKGGVSQPIYDTMICAAHKPNVGACFGDSGGPLVDMSDPSNKRLVGITSWVFGCSSTLPNVFTRVFSHVDWIQRTMDNAMISNS